jgi:hypothetical protein
MAVSIWVSVYCRKQIGPIKADDLTAQIKERAAHFSDLYAQEDPEDALSRLRVETYKRRGRSALLHLHYLEDGVPVVINRITRPTDVAGHVQEYLEEHFQGRKGKQAALVRKHLAAVVEIVSFCLKQRHADGMGAPLVYSAASWLADRRDGLVRVDSQGWMQLTDEGAFARVMQE